MSGKQDRYLNGNNKFFIFWFFFYLSFCMVYLKHLKGRFSITCHLFFQVNNPSIFSSWRRIYNCKFRFYIFDQATRFAVTKKPHLYLNVKLSLVKCFGKIKCYCHSCCLSSGLFFFTLLSRMFVFLSAFGGNDWARQGPVFLLLLSKLSIESGCFRSFSCKGSARADVVKIVVKYLTVFLLFPSN